MRERSAVPAGKPARGGAASVDLVVLTLLDGALCVLVRTDASATGAILPWEAVAPGVSLESVAHAVIRDAIRQSPRWLEQAGAFTLGEHPGDAAISVAVVATLPWREAPTGWSWLPAARAGRRLATRQRHVLEAGLGVARLRSEQAPVAFALLDRAFTLAELQLAYEVLLGRPLHKASFRRALQGAWLVEPLDEWRSEGRGRPAQLFRFAPRRRGARRGVRFDVS